MLAGRMAELAPMPQPWRRNANRRSSAAERAVPDRRAGGGEELPNADGFSCREQIRQTTGRRVLHVAEVLQLALRAG